MVFEDDKTGHYDRQIMFDGDEAKWHQWSNKLISWARSNGVREVFSEDTKPCDDATYKTSVDAEERKVYEANDKVFQKLMMCCTGIAFGLVNQAKTKRLRDGDAFMAWTNLCARYAPNEVADLIQLSGDFNKCGLDNARTDPEEWLWD